MPVARSPLGPSQAANTQNRQEDLNASGMFGFARSSLASFANSLGLSTPVKPAPQPAAEQAPGAQVEAEPQAPQEELPAPVAMNFTNSFFGKESKAIKDEEAVLDRFSDDLNADKENKQKVRRGGWSCGSCCAVAGGERRLAVEIGGLSVSAFCV